VPAYTTVVTHSTGDVFPATDWNTYLRDNVAFLHDRGGDLASAGTITPTNQFHRVTGTTTITAIATPSGSGQGGNRILLKFQSAGCAITAGAALILASGPFLSVVNGMIEFVWDDAAAAWVEIGRINGQAGLELDYKQITAPVSTGAVTTEGTAVAIITGNAVTYDGTRVKLEFWYPSITGAAALVATGVFVKDGTAIGQFKIVDGNQTVNNGPKGEMFDTPSAASHTYAVKAFVSATGVTVNAGAGGAGALLPAFLRVTKA
jgi:hypothetical protein